MENNWKEKLPKIFGKYIDWSPSGMLDDRFNIKDVFDACIEAMNLVFETTKKECAKAIESNDAWCDDDKYEILNINKPNL